MGALFSDCQRATLARCVRASFRGQWYRAASSGERVTLASLWRRGWLGRRTWRGVEGAANAAHEYRATLALLESVDDTLGERASRLADAKLEGRAAP